MSLSRRDFLKTTVALAGASFMASGSPVSSPGVSQSMRVVASGNGLKAADKAMSLLKEGADPLEAVIAGVNLVENDPEDMSVGYGGLPNEEGVVELDASVMHGPTHLAGAVAGLRNIKNPSLVAKMVMERTDHVLLVGEGALKFARAHGFKEEELLTDKSRQVWLRWKENHSDKDGWLAPGYKLKKSSVGEEDEQSWGTINCLVLDSRGDLAGVTTTSGLAFKIPGRVGDSPIIGAGLYVDNDIGAAGSTGRGEANLVTCSSFYIVMLMEQGLLPEEACLRALEKIVRKTKLTPYLLDENDRPKFDVTFYALNKKGRHGSASIWSGQKYALNDEQTNKLIDSAYLFKRL
jgi:N4-(beta-N-acetylglucosaminyl)-L-asparaginase